MLEKIGYLLDVSRRMPGPRLMEELIDILCFCRYTDVYLYRPEGAVEVSPKLEAYCKLQGVWLHTMDKDGYERMLFEGKTVFVPTEARCSLAGRVEDMREQMAKAEETARLRRAERFMVTDFSDECAWQPLAVSLPGIIMGGNYAATGAKAAKMDLEKALNSVLCAPIGGLLLKLGTLYLRGNALRSGCSEFYNILSREIGYSRHPNLTQFVLDDVSAIARGVRLAADPWTERNEWAQEIVYVARLVECACHRRDERRLRELRDDHGRIWRLRYAPEGRVESLARIPRF